MFRDLQPYLCTFEECASADQLYSSRHEWFDHELEIHRRIWQCPSGCQEVYRSQDEFLNHLRRSHSAKYQEAQLLPLSTIWAKPIDKDNRASCPLCFETLQSRKQIEKHVGSHQEDLALFTLPANPDEDEEDDNSGESTAEGTVDESAGAPTILDASRSRRGESMLLKVKLNHRD